ncbi:hypothetical protein K6106_17625 [Pseudomonas fluorescens]|nr:hypothetical protein K6106_17625 [Pseudomonas fluorescens]
MSLVRFKSGGDSSLAGLYVSKCYKRIKLLSVFGKKCTQAAVSSGTAQQSFKLQGVAALSRGHNQLPTCPSSSEPLSEKCQSGSETTGYCRFAGTRQLRIKDLNLRRHSMTSVNTQQQAPYPVGYEMFPAPASTGPEGSTEATGVSDTQPDPTPARQPVRPEQRGPFSSHRAIVNPKPPEAAETRQLAELTQKNNQLLAKLKALIEKFEPQIQRLLQQALNLTQQLNASDKAAPDASVTPASQPDTRLDDERQVAPPETSSPLDTQVSEPDPSRSVDVLTRENDEFRHMVKQAFEQFQLMLARLLQLIGSLAHRIDTMNLPPIPAEKTDPAKSVPAGGVQPETPASTPSEVSVPDNEPTASVSRTIEALKKENQELEGGLDEATDHYEKLISQLQQQIDDLVKKADGQKK